MLRVIDASVVAKWLFEEPFSDRARALLMGSQRGTERLLAPDLLLSEVANTIWKRHVLRGQITRQEAEAALRLLLLVAPESRPSHELSDQALQLAMTHRRPVYDCLYAALALREKCDLVTADERLAAALGPSLGCIVLLSALEVA